MRHHQGAGVRRARPSRAAGVCPGTGGRVVMSLMLRGAAVVGVLAGAGLVVGAAAPANGPAPARLAVGKPATTPARARSGKRFTVSFAVTRSDTHAAPGGRLAIHVSVGGRSIPFSRSYTGGKARVSMLVPPNAIGRL